MSLHPNQEILGAVQLGQCSEVDDTNPYTSGDRKKYLGWEQGHKEVIKEHQQLAKWNSLSLWHKLLCKMGIHKYQLKKVSGRPHINCQTGLIDRRDPIIKKYTCVRCCDVYFIGLH